VRNLHSHLTPIRQPIIILNTRLFRILSLHSTHRQVTSRLHRINSITPQDTHRKPRHTLAMLAQPGRHHLKRQQPQIHSLHSLLGGLQALVTRHRKAGGRQAHIVRRELQRPVLLLMSTRL
jgi:hypothetical protein